MKTFIIFILSVIIAPLAYAQDCTLPATAFQAGEDLHYAFSFKWGFVWLSAGDAHMSVKEEYKDNYNCYHVIGKGGTYKSYDWFFKVRDDYESFIDKSNLHPVRFIRDINEGGYVLKQDVTFDHKTLRANSAKRSVPITACTHDILSAVYYLRNTDMSKVKLGDLIPIPVYVDDSVYNLSVQYVAKEKITNKFGTYNTLKLKPKTIKGTIFKDEDGMCIWVTDDDNHIPVAISSPVLIGEIRVDLVGATGLKHTLNGTIKDSSQ